MTTTKFNYIGSVSHGTMKPEDLIPCFLDVLKELDAEAHSKVIQTWGDIIDKLGNDDDIETAHLLDDLFDALGNCAPPYFFFGTHPGDGSDYGFWLSEGFEQDFEDAGGLKVNDTSEVPADYQGEVLHVNDHGNCTLYVADGHGNLSEVWAVV